jgi:putative transposase
MAIKPGTCGSQRRVVRLMRAAGLEGRRKKRWRTTMVADPAAEAARDLITHISTWQGWAYLATVPAARSSAGPWRPHARRAC